MDIRAFLQVMKRYKWVLIIMPILAAATTYFVAKELPKEYKSQARISTGIIDPSQQLAADLSSGYFSQGQQFGNIMEMMKMKKMMSILSYNLILHDLEHPESAFKEESEEIRNLSPTDRTELIEIYHKKLRNGDILSLSDNEGKFKLLDLVKSMGYGPDGFTKSLVIDRQNNSDFIDIDYTSQNSLLSAYVVNTFANEFIYHYGVNVNSNQTSSIALLDSLLKEKEQVMNAKNAALRDFKMRNGVLNVDAQSEIVYGQISSNETLRAQSIREIQSLTGAIAGIDERLNENKVSAARKSMVSDNAEIVALKNQIQLANERYIDNGFNAQDKQHVDELQQQLSTLMTNSSVQVQDDPKSDRQSLLSQKREMQVSLDIAKNGLASINAELAQAKGRYNKMVPFDAGIGNYERDAEVATKEYLEVLNKTSQSSLESNIGVKLKLAQIGLPGAAEPGKTKILVGISGFSTFMVCLIVLLIGFLLDHRINTPEHLEIATGSPVLGQLNRIDEASPSIKSIWSSSFSIKEYDLHKDLLRSIRFELDKDFGLNGSKILGVTSLSEGVGKSFLSTGLAYAFAKTNRKVLLIGEADLAKNLSDTNELMPAQTFEKFLVKREIQIEDLITILNINASNGSLFEIQNVDNLKKSFDALKTEFDIIIIDIESLKEGNRAKEWLLFTDRIVGVFQAGDEVKHINIKQIDYLNHHKGFLGWVLNKTKMTVNGTGKLSKT